MAVKLIKEGKSLTESGKTRTFSLKFNEKSSMPKNFDEIIMDISLNGIEIYPKREAPCPWDYVCYIEDGKFIMTGGLMAGGPSAGRCTVEVPVSKVNEYYDVKITCDVDDEKELAGELQSYNLFKF